MIVDNVLEPMELSRLPYKQDRSYEDFVVAFAVFTVIRGDKKPPAVPPVSEAPHSPDHASVAGSGLVEASTENISIGTQIAGIVSKIFVQIGSDVKAGDPLFEMDDRSLLAELAIRRATVQVAEAQLADAQYELELAKSLSVEHITSIEERDRKRFAAQKAEAQLAQVRWPPKFRPSRKKIDFCWTAGNARKQTDESETKTAQCGLQGQGGIQGPGGA
ncbi:MAG: efflux RND transporter periplasmic adaptor subunit [Limisphaerales bacterium]